MKNILKLSDICKSVDSGNGSKKEILKNVDLTVQNDEFICIMGPSGCGKSVLLNIIGGIQKASAGSIFLKEKDCSQSIPKTLKADIAYVFQQDNLLEWRTIYKNVRLPLEFEKSKDDEDTRIMNVLSTVGLEKYKECYPKELSGGMRQRASIARALVKKSNILLLDQPFGALDAITRKTLGCELLKIWNQKKKTVLMITNGVEEALFLANKIYIMSSTGAITHEIEVPFNYEERMQNLSEDTRYLALKKTLEGYVK